MMVAVPKEFQPNDYLVVSLIVAIVCGLFNITSLMFSIPALVCSVMVRDINFEELNKTARQGVVHPKLHVYLLSNLESFYHYHLLFVLSLAINNYNYV